MKTLELILEKLETDRRFTDCVTRWEKLPPGEGKYIPFPDNVLPELKEAMGKRGISRLYTHQAESFTAVMNGESIVVVTPTASGKSLCYNLPVIQKLLQKPESRALYIFPTKALSQDQQSELNLIVTDGNIPVKVSTYDGDTPSSVRISARETGRIVISNPDMLHSGILPNHPKWIKFLSHLDFVIIDEIHTYTGVFGSHMANLVRRLKRITGFYGSSPQFICSSATIRNPGELAEKILETPVKLIDDNGAPSGARHVILYNPPLVDAVQGIRRGVVLEAKNVALNFIKEKVKTIIFARSRVRTELIASYLRKALNNFFTDDSRIRVESYRGGYLPGERREIERNLREGKIHGVVSTNALELGIDIGSLDAAVLAGIPSSISSVWQQIGRAGRRSGESAAVLIASASPTDQYLVRHPDYFFSRNPESGLINPDNMYILMDHLKCAVFELPFKEGDEFSGPVDNYMDILEEDGVVRFSGGKWFWADRSYPAEQISLRSSTPENIVIINTTSGKNEVIGEMDLPSAKELLFKGAVYIHRGEQYFSRELDLENKCCHVEESSLNYYTDSIVKTDIKLLQKDSSVTKAGASIVTGDVLVRSQVAKYKKLKFSTHENIGYGEIFLPEEEMHTRAAVIQLSGDTASGEAFKLVPEEIKESVLSKAGTLIRNAAPVFLLCNTRDLGIAERLKDQYDGCPALYIYDNAPGGTGLAEGFSDCAGDVVRAACDIVDTCGCTRGCPSCIGAEESPGDLNIKEEVIHFFSRWLKSNEF